MSNLMNVVHLTERGTTLTFDKRFFSFLAEQESALLIWWILIPLFALKRSL